MPTRIKTLFNMLAVGLAAWATRNSTVVPLSDWQFLLPAIGSALSIGSANGLWGVVRAFLSRDGQAAILKLVSKLLPYRETMMPQEVRDAVLNALRYRFAGNAVAIAHVDALILLDLQMSDPTPETPPKVV